MAKPQAEREQQPSVYSFERFFTLSLDLHVIASEDGYFKHASDSVAELLGWSVAEFLSRPFLEFVHFDDHAATCSSGCTLCKNSKARASGSRLSVASSRGTAAA